MISAVNGAALFNGIFSWVSWVYFFMTGEIPYVTVVLLLLIFGVRRTLRLHKEHEGAFCNVEKLSLAIERYIFLFVNEISNCSYCLYHAVNSM
jgi:hypothetical protein